MLRKTGSRTVAVLHVLIRGFPFALELFQVPARAAAAAAVARKIATLAPQDRLSLPDGSGSMFAARPRGETAEELEEAFYEDVCLHQTSRIHDSRS